MIVLSLKEPNKTVYINNQFYDFVNGKADLPVEIATKLCQGSDYQIEAEQFPKMPYIPFNPKSWKDKKTIVWDGPIGYNNGYGKASMMLIEGLDQVCDLKVINSGWAGSSSEHLSPNLKRILKHAPKKLDSFYLKFFPAFEFRERVAERYVGYTMFEVSRISPIWVKLINENTERIVVPCKHQQEAFIESGVKRDVAVSPLGIIPEWFPYLEREDDDLFYFGTMGTLTYRKGTDVLIKAFMQGLPKKDYPNARLYIKTLPLGGIGSMWFMTKKEFEEDGRIDFCVDSFSPEELIQQFFKKIDCFVFPTRGEGWGLPVMEAMSTGLPVICTNWSGTSDFMTEDTAYRLGYEIVDVPRDKDLVYPKHLQARGQQWAEPNLDELIERMRYAYNHREEGKEMGKRASKHVQENFNAKVSGQKLINYLDTKF